MNLTALRLQLHRARFAIALVVLSLAAPVAAFANRAALAAIRIDNFGVVNDNYYRGAQPRGDDYRDLAALGVKTVIDLTKDGRDDEQGFVEAAGMHFVRIPLTTSEAPSEEAVARFLKIVNDPANQPVYVHCQGGRHRTGTMTAVYRMTQDHWTADKAYQEMKQFKFEGFPGHPELKDFVYHYVPAPSAIPTPIAPTQTPVLAATAAGAQGGN
jgi:protein tyrosine phosphatase (PTP) superfamily phosphohydrolase (DUF442 family)